MQNWKSVDLLHLRMPVGTDAPLLLASQLVFADCMRPVGPGDVQLPLNMATDESHHVRQEELEPCAAWR